MSGHSGKTKHLIAQTHASHATHAHSSITLGTPTYFGRLSVSRAFPWYDYDPCAMFDEGKIKIWWLGRYGPSEANSTDNVLYAESTNGKDFTAARSVMAPRINTGFWDRMHVGNVSIVKVHETYHMYYSAGRGNIPTDMNKVPNAVGYAVSKDGINWDRPTDAIVLPFRDRVEDTATQNAYGAGVPTAIYLDGKFYLMYDDTTGADSNWKDATYVLRSTDPLFAIEVEVLTASGWQLRSSSNLTSFAILKVSHADLMWCSLTRQFMWLYGGGGDIAFADESFSLLPDTLSIPVHNNFEGSNFLRNHHGHTVPDDWGFMIGIYYGFVDGAHPEAHPAFSSDLQALIVNANVPFTTWIERYDLCVIQADGYSLGITWRGKLLQFDPLTLGHVPYLLSNTFKELDAAAFNTFDAQPGVISIGHKVIAPADGAAKPAAFVITEPTESSQGKMWAIDYAGIPDFWERCGTTITYVPSLQYDRYDVIGHSHTI